MYYSIIELYSSSRDINRALLVKQYFYPVLTVCRSHHTNAISQWCTFCCVDDNRLHHATCGSIGLHSPDAVRVVVQT